VFYASKSCVCALQLALSMLVTYFDKFLHESAVPGLLCRQLNIIRPVMFNEAKTSRPRPRPRPKLRGRGRGQDYGVETEAKAKNNYEKVPNND